MSFTDEQIAILNGPLNKANVQTRTNYGGGGDLSYLASWFVIQEANRVFGFDGWSRETLTIERIATTPYSKNGKDMIAVSYMARVRVTVGGVVREGCGYGDGQGQVDKAGAAHELALKEAESDAMKRAFMTFGNPFGLALYDKKQTNVEVMKPKPNRRSKDASRDDYSVIQKLINDAPDLGALGLVWRENWPKIQTMHLDFETEITQCKDDRKDDFDKQVAA